MSKQDHDRGHVFHRHTKAALATAVAGDGIYIIDETGKRYLDASGGAAVSCLGHSDADIIAAAKGQMDRLAYAHTAFFTNPPLEALATAMIDGAPAPLARVYFTSGGSEAIETALKMARQYYVEKGQSQRRHFIARRQSYHGNTLGALWVGGSHGRRAPYTDLMMDAHHIMPAFAYRYQRPEEDEATFAARAADELAQKIDELGPETVIGFVAETVVGSASGAVPAPAGYFKRIREICDRYDILLILDEVMCGMGRTGDLYAVAGEGVAPDMIAVAKGLAAGYQPIGATLTSEEIFATFRDGSGFFQHGHTFMGHATACAAALAVQKKLQAPETMPRVRALGEILEDRLTDAFGQHPHVGDIRGRGLFRGLELVANRQTKEPFDPALGLNGAIKRAAMDRGLICYPGGGTIDGKRGDHVLLAPPFIIEEGQIDELVARLGAAIDDAVHAAKANSR